MAINLSTAGVKVFYAVEETAGTRPITSASFTKLIGIKSIPEANPEPENLETTVLEETEYKTYIAGLKDLGGALAFTANLTAELMTQWEELMTDYETAKSSGLSTWFCIEVPGLNKALYFTGEPSALGMPGMEVNSVLETSLYITPTNAPGWYAKLAA